MAAVDVRASEEIRLGARPRFTVRKRRVPGLRRGVPVRDFPRAYPFGPSADTANATAVLGLFGSRGRSAEYGREPDATTGGKGSAWWGSAFLGRPREAPGRTAGLAGV